MWTQICNIQGNSKFQILETRKKFNKISAIIVGLRHLQSDIEDSDVRLSPISFIIDIGRSALLLYVYRGVRDSRLKLAKSGTTVYVVLELSTIVSRAMRKIFEFQHW
jgi:hypothetical protein